ncbi:MAG: hypothetical protein F4X98_03080, partial [Gammaproteobacteria bacterium]|nr:hypothetical protein [Gammaproteobacteria bacterium]
SKTDSASAGRSATAYGYDPADRRLDSVTVGGAAWTLHHDASGHVTRYERPGDDRFVSWDERGLATEVRLAASATSTSTARDAFAHGPDGARYHRCGEWSGGTEDTYYAGAYEKTYRADGSVVERTRLGAAVHVRTTPAGGGAASSSWEYPHRDHLGSVESVTDSAGAELVVLAHDPYGDRRRPDWTGRLTAASSTALLAAQGRRASRGFTGHEHLDRTGLVHMNGRVYDPLLGRFLSPDPVVSGPAGSQGWALYGYVGNNPLSRTDPTGLFVAGSCSAPGSNCVNFTGGGGPPGGGTRTVTVSSLTRVFGVRVHRTLVPSLTWNRDGRVRVGYGWRTRVRPFDRLVRTVRSLIVAEESPADEPVVDGSRFPAMPDDAGDGTLHSQTRRFPSPSEILETYPDPLGDYCRQADNECAVRFSLALDELGVDISGSEKYAPIHIHGEDTIIQMGAEAMADFLEERLGRPQKMKHPTGKWQLKDFEGREGIIFFPDQDRGGSWNQRHIDVISDGQYGSGFYDNEVVWFWEYKDGRYTTVPR